MPIIIVVKHIKLNAQIFNGTTIEVLKNPFLSIHNRSTLHMHSISKLFAKLGDEGGKTGQFWHNRADAGNARTFFTGIVGHQVGNWDPN